MPPPDRPLTHVILGDGVAGMSAVEAIRRERPQDEIVVVSDDPQPFYYRASLTNYLLGKVDEHELWALPPAALDALRVTFRPGRAAAVDPVRKVVRLEAGGELAYDRLLVATGARARRLTDLGAPTPGADLDGVTVLRTLKDANLLLERLEDAHVRHAVVVGAGFLGLEVAMALAARHVDVTLVQRSEWILKGTVDEVAGGLILRRATRTKQARVDVRLGTTVSAVLGRAGAGGVSGVVLADARDPQRSAGTVPCGLVVLAMGVVPNTDFLAGAVALGPQGHVLVDPSMRARSGRGAEDVYAAGDVARVEDPGARWKNPADLWQPARKQGFVAGRAMAGDAAARYRPGALYNSTRAWDLDLVTIGATSGDPVPGSHVLTTPPGARIGDRPVHKRVVVKDGRVVGALLLGDRREGRALHRLMNLRGSAGDVRAIEDRLFDPAFPLHRWVAEQARQPGVERDDEPVYGAVGAEPDSVARRRQDGRSGAPRGGAPPRRAEGDAPGEAGASVTRPTTLPRPLTLRGAGGRVSEFATGSVRVGAGRGADVRVEDPDVGDEELTISREGAAWLVSTAGAVGRPRALRNGAPLLATVSLHDRDVLALGRWQAVVGLPAAGRAVAAPAPRFPPAWLLGADRHRLVAPVTRVGRDPDMDVVLASASVSRRHAQLEQDPTTGRWYLKDFGSRRGTTVNDEPVRHARVVEAGDVLGFGPDVRLRLDVGIAPAEDPRAETVPAVPASGPCLYLVGVEGRRAGRSVAIPLPGIVGRSRAATVCIDDPLLSKVHARFEGAGDGWHVEDVKSRNGIVLRSTRIAPGVPVRLAEGDELGLGGTRWRVAARPLPDAPLLDEAPAGATTTCLTTVEADADGPRLVVTAGGAEEVRVLYEARVTVGSARDNDVVLAFQDVSDRHAELLRAGGGWSVVDVGSRYGTRADGLPVVPGRPVPLRDGTSLVFGTVAATFRAGAVRDPAPAVVVPKADAGPAPVRLVARARDKEGVRLEPVVLRGDGPWVLGRRRPEAEGVFPVDTVSRRHARLHRDGDGFRLEDLGSENGTWSGVAVRADGEVWKPAARLGRGDVAAVPVGAWFFLHEVPVQLEVERGAPSAAVAAAVPADGALAPAVPAMSRRGPTSFIRVDDGASPLDAELEDVVHDELDACIGCHECMDACPLEDHRLVTIAGLNAYAQGIGSPSGVVARFVGDCTQCHACVPVCPADLMRSRIVLYNKMKEDRNVDPSRRLPVHVGDVAETSDVTVGDLARRLSSHALLSTLPSDERLAFLSRVHLRRLAPGETVLSEGTFPDAVWGVVEGRVEVGMGTGRRAFQRMVVHGPGELLGEVAVLSDQPSDVTARAVEPSLVMGLSKFLLLHHARRVPAFHAALEARYADRAAVLDARRWPELAGLPDRTAAAVRRVAVLARHAPEETVLEAVRQAKEFVLVLRGFVREVRRDPEAPAHRRRTTTPRDPGVPDERDPELIFANYVGAGEGFGGSDSGRRGVAERFVASTGVEVVRVARDDLAALEAAHPGARLVERFERIVARRRREGDPAAAGRGGRGSPAAAGLAREAEREGLLHGQRLLLIDTRLCVDCDNCVSACERRHGWARLDRDGAGTQVGPYQVPASCFHCDDPLCLLCAEEAIVRLPGGEIQVQTERCIGCGACAERCPYDNIEMVPVAPPRRSFLQRWAPDPVLRWLGLAQAAEDEEGARVAVKCDLCAGYADGPACVRACPVGAARRDDPRSIFLGAVEGAS